MLDVPRNLWDIESLKNVFTLCNYDPIKQHIDVWVLFDNTLDVADAYLTPEQIEQRKKDNAPPIITPFVIDEMTSRYIAARVLRANRNFTGSVTLYDLHNYSACLKLINTFGAKDDTNLFETLAANSADFSMFVNDTDIGYSPDIHPYFLGYNSFNYDTTMYALFTAETFWVQNGKLAFNPPTAKTMREHNDNLFSAAYKERMYDYLKRYDHTQNKNGYGNRENLIRQNMLRSGRHIDVAALNEKLQKVGLKRVLGMLGFQILESKKIRKDIIRNIDELADLIAYNASDCINLDNVFNHQVYKSKFELKRGLLESYPELVYDRKTDIDENGEEILLYEPDIRPDNVRKDRLYIDSTSAKLAAKTLCPYGHLDDIEYVSFLYPSEKVSREKGIPRVNVLDEARKFFYSLYGNNPELLAQFDKIYYFYKNNIEGKNFNDSDEYFQHWAAIRGNDKVLPAQSTSAIPKTDLTLLYYDENGAPSGCYTVFGIGGIHGAEYNKALYDADMQAYLELENLFDYVKKLYPNPTDLKTKDPKTKKARVISYKGVDYKPGDFLKNGSTAAHAEWKDISKKRPQLFKMDEKGNFKLNKTYAFTSNADSNHEDFTSYYPILLINMMAFYNEGLGYDRYYEIFQNKQKYGDLMKSADVPDDEKYRYSNLREGTKLILNSASGAADASYFTPIRMNNQIMSMRIIGQLFTWRIGQAQTYAGAKIISTNTDGLFSVCEPEENARILAREAANINVDIKPEFCHLISKDTNNRIEISEKGEILAASGGSLACYKGPNPTKSLAHAAIIDWALAEYFRTSTDPDFANKPFDLDRGRDILAQARQKFSKDADYLKMFQTVVASSYGSDTYIFGETENFLGYKSQVDAQKFNAGLFDAACSCNDINIMQHYNRVFFVNRTLHTQHGRDIYKLRSAVARVITPAQKLTRQRNNERLIQHSQYALAILARYGLDEQDIAQGKEAKVSKVSGIDLDWLCYIDNRDLFLLEPDDSKTIIDNLNMDAYLGLIADSFNANWRNELPDAS